MYALFSYVQQKTNKAADGPYIVQLGEENMNTLFVQTRLTVDRFHRNKYLSCYFSWQSFII